MSSDNDKFASELVEGLGRLSGRVGAGPSPEQIVTRLRRRTKRRYLSAGGGLVVAIIAVLVLGIGLHTNDVDNRSAQQIVNGGDGFPQPLALGSAPAEVERTLRQYMQQANLGGSLLVEKSPGGGLSYAYSGAEAPELDVVKADLERLFQHYEVVDVVLRSDHLSYTLIATAW